jgi:hypothetical protein
MMWGIEQGAVRPLATLKSLFLPNFQNEVYKCRRYKAETYIFLGGQLTAETSDGAFNLVHCIVRLLQVLENTGNQIKKLKKLRQQFCK